VTGCALGLALPHRFAPRPANGPARALAHGLALALASCAGWAHEAGAQVALRDLVAAQAGRSKLFQPVNRTALYHQLNLDATLGVVRLGLRYESDQNSERTNTYRVFTQRFAEVADEHLRLRAGNFYTILGRGLVQRAFELPDVVLEEPGVYARYGFSRDVDGVLLEGDAGPVSARLLAGEPNPGTSAPVDGPTHAGGLGGGEAALRLWRGSRIGATYLRHTNDPGTRQDELASGFVDLDPLRLAGVKSAALPVYAEYAQLNRSWEQWWRLPMGDQVPHAFYAASNVLWGPLSLAAEWKDYRRFRLGFNDPPSLVREHGFTLLNRSTHVLDAESEHGYQLEAAGSDPRWGSLTVNQTRSEGTPAGRSLRFEETYWELRAAPGPGARLEATLYVDHALDEFDFVSDRDVYGGSATVRLPGEYSTTLDLARKDVTGIVAFGTPPSWSDRFLSVVVSRAEWGSAAFQWERTNDPHEEDPVRPVDPQVHALTFASGTVAARLGEHFNTSLFYGKRRGGLACTAGTCYKVEPFKGAELRLTARF
jgi:hypothetical protein